MDEETKLEIRYIKEKVDDNSNHIEKMTNDITSLKTQRAEQTAMEKAAKNVILWLGAFILGIAAIFSDISNFFSNIFGK